MVTPMMKKSLSLAAGLVLALCFLSGCGKNEAAASGAPAAGGGSVLEFTANDSMKFNLTVVEVKAGQEITVVLTNIGSMPKAAMGHNWVLLRKGTDAKAFSDAAVSAVATDYLPAAMQGDVLAHTKVLGPKQSDEIKFTVPTEPGDYVFLCSFPAHFSAGMKGTLRVK
jgi:azurin